MIIHTNKRVKLAERKRNYTRAAFYFADHIERLGAHCKALVIHNREPVNFNGPTERKGEPELQAVANKGALWFYVKHTRTGWQTIWKLGESRGTCGVYPTRSQAVNVCGRHCSP